MNILGICTDVWISSACLLKDGKIAAAGAEERFNRQKMSKDFPFNAIRFCLDQGGISFEDVDIVAVAWNPGIHLRRMNARFSKLARWRAEYLYSVPNQLMPFVKDREIEYIEQTLKAGNRNLRIFYVTHHMAHAANAFFLSPFDEALILTVDGRGEDDTAFFGEGRNNEITKLGFVEYPHSLGLLYGTFTQFLGFTPDSDEWKVMALASYGSRDNDYYEKIKKLVTLADDGCFELDLGYFDYYLQDRNNFYSKKFLSVFGEPSKSGNDPVKRDFEIASALQQVTEESLAHMLKSLREKTGAKNVVAGGGVFMNSVFNGKILNLTNFENVFISSCPDDSGTSIGAALYVWMRFAGGDYRGEQTQNYYGPEFSNKEIKSLLEKYKIKSEYVEDIEQYTAKLIADGSIVGWFQGRMEFGQRALGNRSILADPRDADMKDKVNMAVKYREQFRPFAPSILEECVSEYFECEPGSIVPFMEKVYPIRKDKQSIIPAVTHIDGTGRLQTVSRVVNERYYLLIDNFKKITGIPIILNTSFNLKGEPIVCSPTDAIRTFYSCGLDYLVLGNYIISKLSK